MLPLASKIKPTVSGTSSVEKYSIFCSTLSSKTWKFPGSKPTTYLPPGSVTVALISARSTSTLIVWAGTCWAKNGVTSAMNKAGSPNLSMICEYIRLPGGSNRILRDTGVRGQEDHAVDHCLADKNPVEWIAMEHGESYHMKSGFFIQRQ